MPVRPHLLLSRPLFAVALLAAALLAAGLLATSPALAQGRGKRPPEGQALDHAKELLRFDRYDEAIALLSDLCPRLAGRADAAAAGAGAACELHLGEAYAAKGELGAAMEHFSAARAASGPDTPARLRFEIQRRLGETHARWGDLPAALKELQAALDAYGDKVEPERKAIVLERMGRMELHQGNRAAGEAHLRAALAALGGNMQNRQAIDLLLALSGVAGRQGRTDEARSQARKALDLARELRSARQEGNALMALARVEIDADEPAAALPLLHEALAQARAMGRARDEADCLHLLGEAHYDLDRFAEAADLLRQSAALKERQRGQVEGETRRQYLASQIGTWNLLIDACAQLGDAAGAFAAFEASRARFLAETLGTDRQGTGGQAADLAAFQASLPQDTAVLVTALTGRWRLRLIVITREGATVHAVRAAPGQGTKDRSPGPDGQQLAVADAPQGPGEGARGLAVTATAPAASPATTPAKNEQPPASLAEELLRYRRLLADPADAGAATRMAMARRLYDLVVGPAAPALAGKRRLVATADAALALVPLETLITPSGRYLAEELAVSYAASAAVLGQMRARAAAGGAAGQAGSAVVVGGARYGDAASGQADRAQSYDADALAELVDAALAAKGSLRFAYKAMGADSWADLPGSLAEAREVAGAFPGALLLTGPEATETRLKELDRAGELAQSRVLHLAVHGLAVPDIPELSALVLGREPPGSAQDGYLAMREIAALRLGGGLVTLSACQTGLGRVFRGEGVVGLAQAFLHAGAGGLAVTLWSVSDASAPAFMSRVYGALGKGASFADAFAEARRAFIRGEAGERFARPSHWAPFVVHGL